MNSANTVPGISSWDDLNYWNTGEWQVVQEKLEDNNFNPLKENLFAALNATPFNLTKVVLMGQDPYPALQYSTGLAFSIPLQSPSIPPTLRIILQELENDLHLPFPKTGNLEKWASQGVLLWNAIPSCETGKSMSHDWTEWSYLTQEMVESLSAKGNVVFALLGGVARRYSKYVDTVRNDLIETGHPSPRGNMASKSPFTGSRVFSTINARLSARGFLPIEWQLDALQPTIYKTPMVNTKTWEPIEHIPPWEESHATVTRRALKTKEAGTLQL